jgi:hypothetical protein
MITSFTLVPLLKIRSYSASCEEEYVTEGRYEPRAEQTHLKGLQKELLISVLTSLVV